jgi:hypothetical protein
VHLGACLRRADLVQPFALDYHETLISLLDVLSELYHRISRILGSSVSSALSLDGGLKPGGMPATTPGLGAGLGLGIASTANTPGHGSGPGPGPGPGAGGVPIGAAAQLGPLGAQTALPGVSYVFEPDGLGLGGGPGAPDNSLWAIAYAGAGAGASPFSGAGFAPGAPPPWTPALGEMVMKIDGKLKVRAHRWAGRVGGAETRSRRSSRRC